MNKFAVNISTVFTEYPFLERFKKARAHGFSYVECQFPYAYPAYEIQRELDQNQLSMVLINLPPGNWGKGDRGIAADPDRIQEFRRSVDEGIRFATALNVARIHCMAGNVSKANIQAAREVYLENIHYAASKMAKDDLALLIEPINQFDMPGYFLNNIEQAKRILDEAALPNVKLQFDFYHMERVHGNALSLYKQYADQVGHIQIADFPGRHQPGTGEMDYLTIFQYLNDTYDGYIGVEYTPSGKSEESFEWLPEKGESRCKVTVKKQLI